MAIFFQKDKVCVGRNFTKYKCVFFFPESSRVGGQSEDHNKSMYEYYLYY